MKNLTYLTICFVLLCLVCSSYGQKLVGPHGYLVTNSQISYNDSTGTEVAFRLPNLYMIGDYLLSDKARFFGEMELEDGGHANNDEDIEDKGGDLHLHRAWFEYAFSHLFKARVGKFLTPYGIYNEMHNAASAYTTPVLPPSIYDSHENLFGQKQRFYAKTSIGVQLLGEWNLKNALLQYNASLVKGRGHSLLKIERNRQDIAFGLRLLSEFPIFGLRFGYSFYTDKNALASYSRQTTQAWDLQFEHKRWLLSVEFARSVLEAGGAGVHDQIANAGYAEMSYQLFNWQTVLLRYDVFDRDVNQNDDVERVFMISSHVQVIKHISVKVSVHFQQIEDKRSRDSLFSMFTLILNF